MNKIELFTQLAKIQETIDSLDTDLWREDFRGWVYDETCECKRCRWVGDI